MDEKTTLTVAMDDAADIVSRAGLTPRRRHYMMRIAIDDFDEAAKAFRAALKEAAKVKP